MKVCHIADIHWRGLKRHEEYRDVFTKLLNDAHQRKVDRIVVAGDIVHTKTMGISPELIQNLVWWFNSLADVATTIVTLGNHDGLILNKSRMDTISPIINMLNNEKIIFLRDSCQYYDSQFNVLWTNFSCFDEDSWSSLSPQDDKINIALFHGPVKRSSTDSGWEIEAVSDMSMFSGYDFGMFGDIHKYQYLDEKNRFAYPGSTIQQDFSEDVEKGYLLWDIASKNEYISKRIVIEGPNPFYTINWEGSSEATLLSCEGLKKGCRLRVSSNSFLSQEEIKKFSLLVKQLLAPEEIAWKITESQSSDNIVVGKDAIEKSSLRDASFHLGAIRDYYGVDKFNQEEWKRIDDTISNIMHSFENLESNRYTKWSIRNLEWDNTYTYGNGNRIDFSNLDGIVGLFGVNRSGKSSIPGTIMYSLFNDTDRGSISNLHVINARKGDCEAKVEFEVNGAIYRAERMSYKWSNGKGEGANTKLNLYRVNSDGEIIEDISGEQRRDSEKILRDLIGSPEDFLLTSFSSQGEMNSFIKSGATDRKKLLNNFLDLGIFEQISLRLKDDSYETKTLLKKYSSQDFDSQISSCLLTLESLEKEKPSIESQIESLKSKETSLAISLATSKHGIAGYSKSDIQKKNAELSNIQEKISRNEKLLEDIDEKISSSNTRIEKIEVLKSSYPIDSLREELSNLRTLELNEAKISSELDKESERLEQQLRSVKKLEQVPCGDQFPTCRFIKDSHRDKSLIQAQKDAISTLTLSLESSRDEISKIKQKSLDEKIKKYEKIISEGLGLGSDLKTFHVEKNAVATSLVDLLGRSKKLEEEISIMRLNMVDDDLSQRISEIEAEISRVSKTLSDESSKLLRIERSIGSEISNLEKYQREKKESEHVNQVWKAFQTLIQAYGKNGLPQAVLAHQLPRINNEISSILQGVCGFTVVLVSNGNDLEINLDYGDSQRPIELGSGMEKMMASLAIRVALINVSSLPKTDMLIIDEGFGALDDVNIEACNRLLISLKRFFKTIIVISHVDAVKDAVDNIIEISKQGADSCVWA